MLYSSMPHAPIYNLLMGSQPRPEATACELAEEGKKKILLELVQCATGGEQPVQMGDERYDRQGYIRALRELYDWLDLACSKSEPAAMFVRSTNQCYPGSCQ